jgi:hypothetical protein
MDKAETKLVYTSSDVSHLAEYYVSDINGQNEKKLTTFNDALQKEVAFSDAERFTYKSVDNLEIEGWLMKPYGYQAGKKYPVVLYITAARTPRTARDGSTNSRASRAAASSCCSRIRAARAERTRRSRTRAAEIGAARTTSTS